MVHIDFDQFDDELATMEELMREGQIALNETALHATIGSLNLKKAVSVLSGTSLKRCLDTMVARHFGCLLITKDGTLAGIFTERDALLKIAGQEIDLAKESIDDFMTPNPATLKTSDTIEDALRLTDKRGHRHVAVVDGDDRPLAVLSVKDIVSFIVEFFPQDILNLPPHPIRVGTRDRHGG